MPRRRMTHDGPRALDRPLSFEEVVEHRNLACGRYSICLEVVVRRQWTSFSCRFCSLWQPRFPVSTPAGPAQVLFMPAMGQR